MDKEEAKKKLKQLIEEDLQIKIEDDDQDLIGSRTLDSYSMLLIITFIRQEYGVDLSMKTLDFDAFISINSIVDLMAQE